MERKEENILVDVIMKKCVFCRHGLSACGTMVLTHLRHDDSSLVSGKAYKEVVVPTKRGILMGKQVLNELCAFGIDHTK